MFSPSEMVRKAKKYLYTDLVTFQCTTNTVNEETGQFERKTLNFGEYPCRISFKNANNIVSINGSLNNTQTITLFIDNHVEVPLNSVIIVKRYGKGEYKYKASGQPNIYSTHQEIALEVFNNRADSNET